MDHRIAALDEIREEAMILERALDPFNIGHRQPGTAGQRAYLMPPPGGLAQDMPSQKPGTAGDGQDHSSTI